MRSFVLSALFLASLLSECEYSNNDKRSFIDYGSIDKCWVRDENLIAYVVVYKLRPEEYTFDFVSRSCLAKEYDLGQPPLFIVSFSPSDDSLEIQNIGLDGQLVSNRILPIPSMENTVGVYLIKGEANLRQGTTGQLRISNLQIINAKKLAISIEDFYRNRVFN